MKPKTIVTILLLLFIAASVVYLAVGELGPKPDVKTTPVVPTAVAPGPAATPPGEDLPPVTSPVETSPPDAPRTTEKASPETFVNVYYFHGNYRCITCRTIEMYTREAVNEAFLTELGDGRLHLKVLNMQDPENESYVNDFKLEYYIVVLEKVVDGKRVQFKKLEGVWDLLGDKAAFKKYVQDETRNYLKGIDQ